MHTQVEITNEKILANGALAPSRTIGLATILFVGLQCLDLITTLAVFSRGGIELNPVVRSLMPWTGQLFALILSKAAVVSMILLINRRRRVLRFGNVLYTAIVAWNMWVFFALK